MQYNVFLALVSFAGFIFSILSQIAVPASEGSLVTLGIQGGIAAMMFIILYFTFKYFSTQLDKALTQNNKQFEKTLAGFTALQQQSVSDFRLLQQQTSAQYQENIERLFKALNEELKYKAYLSETISAMNVILKDILQHQKKGQ